MKIYRFSNGDNCPCCGQVITGKTPEELSEISVMIYGVASALHIADWILRPGEDAIDITPAELCLFCLAEEERAGQAAAPTEEG